MELSDCRSMFLIARFVLQHVRYKEVKYQPNSKLSSSEFLQFGGEGIKGSVRRFEL
jgi:hypothetical protein